MWKARKSKKIWRWGKKDLTASRGHVSTGNTAQKKGNKFLKGFELCELCHEFNSLILSIEKIIKKNPTKKTTRPEYQQFWLTALAVNENSQPFSEMWWLEKVNINGKVIIKDFREKRQLSSIQNVCWVLWKCKFQSPQARLPSLWNSPSHMNVREVYKTTAFLWPIHLELLEFPA